MKDQGCTGLSLLFRRGLRVLVTVACAAASASLPAQALFDIPLRINMGGAETVDSHGDVWLGDGPGGGDPLNIRPNDGGGTNWIENWSIGVFQGDSLADLGFDPTHPGDSYIFNTIRWDVGGDGIDFELELPVPDGQYLVNLYFNEGCCTNRHFKIEIQGDELDDDVSFVDYDPDMPALGRVGRLSFGGIGVSDEVLRIALRPCPGCPGATDTNAIIDAIEVLTESECSGVNFNFSCVYDPDLDRVNGTWDEVPGAEGYRVLKNGAVFLPNVPVGTTSFVDANPRSGGSIATYAVQALDGGVSFAECSCEVLTFVCPRSLMCTGNRMTGVATLTWQAAVGIQVDGFEVRRGDELVATLPAGATGYEDIPGQNQVRYTVTPLTTPAGQCPVLSCNVTVNAVLFPVPFRVNAGGPEVTDSRGSVWLGDQGAGLDPLGLRPQDGGGANTIEAWCTPSAQTLEALDFDPSHPGDATLFRSIRWDTGGDAFDYVMEIPIPNDSYTINLYFCEACCPQRHFQVEIQGSVVADNVSRSTYANDFHQVGRLSFPGVIVDDRLLTVALRPCPGCDCPECVGAVVLDINAILSALEVIPSNFDPCTVEGFRGCPGSLVCTVDGAGAVSATFSPPQCFQVEGYDVLKNGTLLQRLAPQATGFSDTLTDRAAAYEVVPHVPAGIQPCRSLTCTVVRTELPFSVPLRINMGGPGSLDSRGRFWLPDPGVGQDVLQIRPDDLGGVNVIQNWCDVSVYSNPDSLLSLGLDPTAPGDLVVFDTIRWDVGDDDNDGGVGEDFDIDGGDVDFRLEIPLPNGDYHVNFYFTECCCPFRHFRVEVQGIEVGSDLHSGAYAPSGRLGRTGTLSAEGAEVTDGLLRIRLSACPLCAGFGDGNAILNALEVLPDPSEAPRCPHDLVCVRDFDGSVTGTWAPPEDLAVDSYELRRNGEVIDTLGGAETSFTDTPPCTRVSHYELVPRSAAPGFLCPDQVMRCSVVDTICPFEVPLRINMGGPDLVDSQGRIWTGDPGQGLDVLDIRPDDLGGANVAVNWEIQNFRPASLEPLGFDPGSPVDQSLMSTIRWDTAADDIDYHLVLPVPNGDYTVNLYFAENFWNPPEQRRFKLVVQGTELDADFSTLDYSPQNPVTGWAGRVSLEAVEVEDEFLRISLPPCSAVFECPGAADTNAILNLLEVLAPEEPKGPFFVRGDSDSNSRLELTDAIQILNFLFLGFLAPVCRDAADSDDNGVLEITDAVRTLNFLFLGTGQPPAPPTPTAAAYPARDCGVDPTPGDRTGDLGCSRESSTCSP
jgi:hypothetical protein